MRSIQLHAGLEIYRCNMECEEMNICIFNGDMSRGGGTERITQILANGLADKTDYVITVLNLNNESGNSYYTLDPKVKFEVLYTRGIRNKTIELRKLLKKEKIDVLIDVDIMLGIYSLPATAFLRRIKVISWEMFNIRNDIGSKYTRLIRKICLKRSAYYINQTKGDMEAFIKEMSVKCPITYIYNPCEIDMSYSNYNSESKTIVTAGHFFYTKGYDLAVDVAKKVFAKHPDWCWKFYGDGIELDKIKNMVHNLRLENNMIFCGRTNEITSAYKEAAMYVMTSRTEGFGLVLTEAKSCNLPTIAYDIDFGPREIIDHEVSGYLVPAFNSDEMSERICELIENKEKRIMFSKRAKDNCDKFTKQAFIEKWVEIFEEINGEM